MKKLLFTFSLLLVTLTTFSQLEYGAGYNATFSLKTTPLPIGLTFYAQNNDFTYFLDGQMGIPITDDPKKYRIISNFAYTIARKNDFSLSPYIGVGLTIIDNTSINTSFGLLFENDGTFYGIGYNSNPDGICFRIGFCF